MTGNLPSCTWIDSEKIRPSRWNAEFYKNEFKQLDIMLESSGISLRKLKQLSRLFTGPFGSKLPASLYDTEGGVPLLRVQNVGELFLDESNIALIPKDVHQDIIRSKLEPGDLALAKAGRLGALIRIPNHIKECNITQHIVGIKVNKQKVNSSYLCAFLMSKYGKFQLKRQAVGTIIKYLGIEETRDAIVSLPNPKIQDYIGHKIVLSEECRVQALKFKNKARNIFDESIGWDSKYEISLLSRWVPVELLSSRIDLNFNSPRKVRLIEYLRLRSIECNLLSTLVDISAMIGWKGLTTEHYVDDGPWLLRGVEYRDGYIDYDSLVSVEQFKYDEQPQIHLKYKDVAMTKDGTIGKALVIPKLHKLMAAGSTIARLRIKDMVDLNPYYLEFTINHPVVQIQIQSFATGLAQPHITQEWIAQLLIPRIPSKEVEIASYMTIHHHLMEKAHNLSREAQADVEFLIEGKLETDDILSGQLKAPTWEDIEKELEGI